MYLYKICTYDMCCFFPTTVFRRISAIRTYRNAFFWIVSVTQRCETNVQVVSGRHIPMKARCRKIWESRVRLVFGLKLVVPTMHRVIITRGSRNMLLLIKYSCIYYFVVYGLKMSARRVKGCGARLGYTTSNSQAWNNDIYRNNHHDYITHII